MSNLHGVLVEFILHCFDTMSVVLSFQQAKNQSAVYWALMPQLHIHRKLVKTLWCSINMLEVLIYMSFVYNKHVLIDLFKSSQSVSALTVMEKVMIHYFFLKLKIRVFEIESKGLPWCLRLFRMLLKSRCRRHDDNDIENSQSDDSIKDPLPSQIRKSVVGFNIFIKLDFPTIV